MACMTLISGAIRSRFYVPLADINSWIRWTQEKGFGIEVMFLHG